MLCVTNLISLVAAAFRHQFQWAALLCLTGDASQICSLVKQAFVQVPHESDWFGFYRELWHFSIIRKDYISREFYHYGNSETNLINVQFNLLPPKQACMGRIFSCSVMKASWKKDISPWDYPAFSPASVGRWESSGVIYYLWDVHSYCQVTIGFCALQNLQMWWSSLFFNAKRIIAILVQGYVTSDASLAVGIAWGFCFTKPVKYV